MGTLLDGVCLSSCSGDLHKPLCATPFFSKIPGGQTKQVPLAPKFLEFYSQNLLPELSQAPSFLSTHGYCL